MAADLDGDEWTLPNLKKRRGVVRRSITYSTYRLGDLEKEEASEDTRHQASRLLTKLETLDRDFRALHFGIIDFIDAEDHESLDKEQEALDAHDNEIAALSLRLHHIIKEPPAVTDPAVNERPLSRKLTRIETGIEATGDTLSRLVQEPSEIPLLQQHQEKLDDYKKELSSIYNEILALDLKDDHRLVILHSRLERLQFDSSHKVKKLIDSISSRSTPKTAVSADKTSKLPKLDIPTFDGDVLNWQKFWEQFLVSVHDRTNLSNAEKLVYLQQAIKNGSAKSAIEGLSRSGDQYKEAVDCLKTRYNRPRTIYRAHVRTIMDIQPLKDGNGKELQRFHDVLQQHLRALKTVGYEPDAPFITSLVELKLDSTTMFEWQKFSQDKVNEVPHYLDLLGFLDLRAQASETSLPPKASGRKPAHPSRNIPSFPTNVDPVSNHCRLCPSERHPLYACPRFKAMSHDDKRSTLRKNGLCFNCLQGKHFTNQCKSLHRCKKCQRLHHTLLHYDNGPPPVSSPATTTAPPDSQPHVVFSNTAVKLRSSSLLMTCKVLVSTKDGPTIEVRALLDNASSASFVSERLAQVLQLPRSHQAIRVSGIAGSSPSSPTQSVSHFQISPVVCDGRKIDTTAIIVPKYHNICPAPHFQRRVSATAYDLSWTHLTGIPLADPSFGQPGRIDILLGVDIFVDILLHGRRTGPPGSPVAIETKFGWVLSGNTDRSGSADQVSSQVASFHASTGCADDILRKFWEVEEPPTSNLILSHDERTVLHHFKENHFRTKDGKFVVPLPRRPDAKPIGESRSQAVRRFLSLERSLISKNRFQEVNEVIQEYLTLKHAEVVPVCDLDKDPSQVFYMPMHVVYKGSSATTKIRAVFDASAKSTSGVSLNDTLLVGPTIHPPLIDVLLRFRMHRIALTADVSKMYRAVELVESDRDFHRFIWRAAPSDVLQDLRMTRATFGVSASCFAANMAVKQNAIELAHEFPLAAKVVDNSFYVDDALTGADDVPTAISLQAQLQGLFSRGGFLLRKWNSSELSVVQAIPPDLRETKEVMSISNLEQDCTKTLGVEWNTSTDTFRVQTSKHLFSPGQSTKRSLLSDIGKIFDVLGWFSPAIIGMKILLQRIWELRIGWDDPVPDTIQETWNRWRSELDVLSTKNIPRCYFPKHAEIASLQLHGFGDASENAYAGVVYLRTTDTSGASHISLVMAKTRVAPIKRMTIPRLELCGARIVAGLLHHVKSILSVPLSAVYAWTDSTIVLHWLSGNPRRFKTYVGNRVSEIVDQIPPERWNHVISSENPADCASRGTLPSDLLEHSLWWNGPTWLSLPSSQWPQKEDKFVETPLEEEREICMITATSTLEPIILLNRFSSFTRAKRVLAWILRFVARCRRSPIKLSKSTEVPESSYLTPLELETAEKALVRLSQNDHFLEEITLLKSKRCLSRSSNLLSLHPFIDSDEVLRVGGRECKSQLSYSKMHPVILHGKHPLAKLIIPSEHTRLLHAGATLVFSSLTRRFHIIGMRKTIRSILRQCVTCRRRSARPQEQIMGQLPIERVTPGTVFETVGVDYAGPLQVKYGMVRRPVTVKAYICVFVSLTVKAVHLEAVSDLTTEAFVATLRRFIARRGCPSLIWSDNGSNFIGANKELKELFNFLAQKESKQAIANSCSSQGIEWRFIPEHSPHFGGLWEAAVKSTKHHLRCIVGSVKLTFEELTTVLAQIEACLNSRPLVPVNVPDEDGIEVLTPGHFLVGRPLCALPDPSFSQRPISLLRRWQLCQGLLLHFWKRWSDEYLTSLNRFNKWHHPKKSVAVGDIVILREDNIVPTKWPLARVERVHPGTDGHVRVVTVKTSKGTYKRPVAKIVLLLNPEP